VPKQGFGDTSLARELVSQCPGLSEEESRWRSLQDRNELGQLIERTEAEPRGLVKIISSRP